MTRLAPVPRLPPLLPKALVAFFTLTAVTPGCDEAAFEATPHAYLSDSADRRGTLESALWQPELPYSRSLLSSYGLGTSGWDLLPEMPTASRAFTTEDAQRLAAGEGLLTGTLTPVGGGLDAGDDVASLGERVFYDLPMRYDGYLTWAMSRPELWADIGLTARDDGTVRGVVVYEDVRGDVRAGVTCALCHAAGDVPGRAERRMDLGLARGLYYEAVGVDATRALGWGPGRIDVTDDEVDSPTQIPDLWGLEHAQYLNHSGAIRVDGPETLAVRFETQYILGQRLRSRPPRELTWALAAFVRQLVPPRASSGASVADAAAPLDAAPTDDAALAAGQAIFTRDCAGCHAPSRGYSGGLVPVDQLAVDPAVALTPERGTGFYKVPSLLGVARNAPYLHDGSAASLEALLASGHPFGDAAPAKDAARDGGERRGLITFLDTL